MIIYKYTVPVKDDFVINMPRESEILSFQNQNDILNIWCAVHENNDMGERKFSLRGTGHYIDMYTVKKFIGTAQQFCGTMVWHLFEMK